MTKIIITLVTAAALGGCDMLKPRVDDIPIDAQLGLDAPDPDSGYTGPKSVLPPGTPVPSIEENGELLAQIKVYDGLNDNALMMAGGVVTRSTGKAGGTTVRFWSFGSALVVDNFLNTAPVYVLADDDGAGNLTPRTDHPWLIDSIPGDARYAAFRRIIYVPVTAQYAGQLITSIDALNEAVELGLVGEPTPAGTWRNMPVVPPGTKLELGGAAAPMEATKVYGRGYVIELLPMGYTQPLAGGRIPMGQEARLLSGVAAGTPPSLPTALETQPVFQYGIPAGPPTTTFNYTPAVTQVEVRLANGVAPSAITSDAQLFARAASGGITGYYTDSVATYVVTTNVSNKQIQFAEGSP
jgi:hypothetical protein